MSQIAPAAGRGLLLVLSGPSGSGKSSLAAQLLQFNDFPIALSISATSRAPRPGEIDGVHYQFLTQERFQKMRDDGAFLESAEVHGNHYGTPRAPVEAALASGKWVLLEIDVQGFKQVKAVLPETCSFFLRAPSLSNYEDRLKHRNTDSPAAVERRLADAREQLRHAADYDFQIVNDALGQAARTFRVLLWGLVALKGDRHVG